MGFTVFAPTNEGFAALPEGTLDTLLKPENKDTLVDILTYHVLASEVLSTDLKFFQRVKTVEGKSVHVYKTRKGVFVSPDGKDFKTVVGADNKASNGVAHIIDGVLIPPAGLADALPNIVELAQSVSDLSTLVAAVVAGGLVDTLTSAGPFTVLAPTNEGFAALPAGTVESLLKPENKATLVDILTYHVLPVQANAVVVEEIGTNYGEGNCGLTETVEGLPLRVMAVNGKISVGSATEELRTVTAADNFATNGVVHIIDGVMLPSSFESEKLIRLTSKTGTFDVKDGKCYQLSVVSQSDQLNDQRIICQPNGDAFILQYKSSDGSCYNERIGSYGRRDYILKGRSISSNLKFDCSPAAEPNIVELAESASDLSTLVAAVVAGDLVDTLSSAGPFTVFAPTNEGFAALGSATLDTLMKPENKAQLVDILTYHVVSGKVLSTDLTAFQEVPTVEGKKLHITVFGGFVKVGASLASKDLKTVTAADNLASNGVVHIINGVMLPPSSDVVV